jgi:hypothetical protein
MLSVLELRRIIESGFLPLSCTCTISPDGSLTIKVYEASSGRVDLLVTGVSVSELTSSRALANLIAELRSEIAACQGSFRKTAQNSSS